MVRKSASEKMAKDSTDMRDPAFQDLYIPRKEGDSTGSSAVVNDLATGLAADGSDNALVNEAVKREVGRPVTLRESTKFKNEPNTTGITLGAGAGPANARPTTDFDSWIDGALKKYNHPMLAEIQKQRDSVPIVENTMNRFRLADSPYQANA